MANDQDTRPAVGFDLYRVAQIEAEADAKRERIEEGWRRIKPGRPRIHQEPRQDVRAALPVELIAAIDAVAGSRTAFIEAAVREKLAREG